MLGADFQLGSVAANTIFPGGTGQEPHVDYPYWDYFKRDNWPVPPKHRDVPFFMNMQVRGERERERETSTKQTE